MKYWRGYLVAGIIAMCDWMLSMFAFNHPQLVDMVYPYVSRIFMDYMASWSSAVSVCLWQVLLVFLILLAVASVVLMIVLRWNPIQWFGWVLACITVFSLLNTGVYGLNQYAGPISEDVRLEMNDYSVGSLERAANYYRDLANAYSKTADRDSSGKVHFGAFDQLALQAADGFHQLSYERTFPTFTGSTVPVKELGFSGFYPGTTGVTVALTGESAVNPNVPQIGLPYAICHEMTHRMCVYNCTDGEFGGFLACIENPSDNFRYSGYLMAFRHCYNALSAINTNLGRDALARVMAKADDALMRDLRDYNEFLGPDSNQVNEDLCKMLVSWHIQEDVQAEEPDIEKFDPMDETDDRLQDILYPDKAEEEE